MKTTTFLSILSCIVLIPFISWSQSEALPTSSNSEFSIIIEAGSLNSNVTSSLDMSRPEFSFRENLRIASQNPLWISKGGFVAGIKVAKRINNHLMDSKVSLDFISGVEYKETNITQSSYSPHYDNFLLGCFAYYFVGDIKVKSISIPLEVRTNFTFRNFSFSPTLGIGINVPTSKTLELFIPEYIDGNINHGELYSSENLESIHRFTYNTISKMEISYLLPNKHKIKCAAFYNLHMTSELSDQLADKESLATKGLQVAYEIPIGS